jgi:hypothetical protein
MKYEIKEREDTLQDKRETIYLPRPEESARVCGTTSLPFLVAAAYVVAKKLEEVRDPIRKLYKYE